MFDSHWKPDEDISLIAQAFGTHEVSDRLGIPDYDVVKGMSLSIDRCTNDLRCALEEGDIARVYAALYATISNSLMISQTCGLSMGIAWDQCIEEETASLANRGRRPSREEIVAALVELIGG
jgi:hypothetical protein